MATIVLKRNTTLKEVIQYWNNNTESNVGIGRLKRELVDGKYLITKIYGREDIALFNVNETAITINGDECIKNYATQYSLEPDGVSYRTSTREEVKDFIRNWVQRNKVEIKEQLHYIQWFNTQTIVKMTVENLITLLESYTYDESEAEVLFENLSI